MNYGQIINPQYDPTKNYVYEAFYQYFNYPVMTKIKDVTIYSMYMTKIHAMLGNAYRYLIVFVNKDANPVGHKQPMQDLEWSVLQTRTLEDQHRIQSHTYTAERKPPMDQKITIKSRNDKLSTYEAETYPLVISLLHTRKNHAYQYQPVGTIASALETYQTIVEFKKKD